MPAKIPACQQRLFKNVFVCRNCSSRIRADPKKIVTGSVRCRKCKKRAFRPIRKK